MKKTRIIFTKTLWVLLLASITRFGYSNTTNYPSPQVNLGETLACNDTVNVSVNLDCIAKVTPDQLLEGDYADYSVFEVNVFEEDGNSIGDTVTSNQVGKILLAEVTDTTTGKYCSSRIKVVDKVAPVFACQDVYTTCYDDMIPGDLLPHNFNFEYDFLHKYITEGPGDTLFVDLPVGNVPGAVVTDLDVELNITHNSTSDLRVFIISPEQDTFWLFKELDDCAYPDLEVRFDDQAKKTHKDFKEESCSNCCPGEPGVKGRYQALDTLAKFADDTLTGTWKIGIVDSVANSETGQLNSVKLFFKQEGGVLEFPIPESASTPIHLEGNKYEVLEGFDLCGTATLSYTDELIEKDCSSKYSAIIERNWTGTDKWGNESYCLQKIYVIRTGTSFLEFPPNYDGIDEEILYCKDAGIFDTGEPIVNSELCDMVTVISDDDTVDICSGSFKVYRNWRISEMCSSEVIEHTQIIFYMDNIGPNINDIENITVSTQGLLCSKDIEIKFPKVEDECSDDDLITLNIGYQELDENGTPLYAELLTDDIELVSYGNYIFHAEVGVYKITYTATDDCGNSSTTTNIITLRDDSPPVAVCQEHTQVSINLNGEAKVNATSFDDGSHDNCSDVILKVRRMNDVCNNSDDTFKDAISFCCQDVNTTQMVELLVSDGANTNTCMVEVNIVDKLGPKITCPNDTTISCSENYEQLFGTATAYDNCGTKEITTEIITNTIGQCNTGYVVRKWSVEDEHGHSDDCLQTISVVDEHIFTGDDIVWPPNKDYTNCVKNFDTSITGYVTFKNEDFCSMVASRYEDEVFNVIDGACLKILRHWEVIDWCHYDDDPDGSVWRHTQVIKLNNTEPPRFDSNCSDKTFKTYGECKGMVDYEKNATDDCTEKSELNWTHYIDLNLDGVWDIGPIHSNKIHRVFENGTYKVAWIVEDGCGNSSNCEETLYVKDGKNPTPLCISKLTTAVMNEFGMVTICAEKFNLGQNCDNCPTGSYDNCTPRNKLRYSFSTDLSDSCRTYTCDSIPNGQFVYKTLNMYVTDEAGNYDYCTVIIRIEDNEADACGDSTGVYKPLISGLVYDPNYNKMKNVEMSLYSTEGQEHSVVTDETGVYAFNNINTATNFELEGEYHSSYIDGVSTLDIVLIQKHILGISKFTTPEKFIAADINFSKSITAADILIIRKAILGIKDDFGKKGKSWAFTADNENFRSSNNVLQSWEESINLAGNVQDQKQNWVGIKMGDINGSIYGQLESRSDNKALLFTKEMSYEANEEIEVPFTFENINKISGGQFTLNFDLNKLTFVTVIPNEDLINRSSFGLNRVDKGSLTLSWVKPDVSVNNNDVLFTVVFKTNSNDYLSEAISIGDNITKAEAYSHELEVMDIELQMRDSNDNYNVAKLYGNTPNPFTGKTSITFELPENQKVDLKFYDVAGKLIKSISQYYSKGYNSVDVSFENNINGVIYCKMNTNDFTSTTKMIRIK